jgi:hypothetical protein
MSFIINYWHWFALSGLLFYFFSLYKKQLKNNNFEAIAVEYEPPRGLSLLQAAYILDRSPDEKDITAAILELGSLGYLRIEKELKELSVLDKIQQFFSPLVLKKTDKNSNGLSRDQRIVLRAILFKQSNKFLLTHNPETRSRAIQQEIPYLNETLHNWAAEKGYVEQNILKARSKFFLKNLLILLPIVVLTYFTLIKQYGNNEEISTTIFLLLVFSTVGIAGVIMLPSFLMKLALFLFGSMGAMLPYLMLYKQGYSIKELLINLAFGPYGIIIISIIILSFLSLNIGKLTAKGRLLQRQLLGLKEYIKRVKKKEIQYQLQENALHLEKLLPYAVLFGETGQWLPLFKSLKAKSTTWHEGDIIELLVLEKMIKGTVYSV